MQDLQIERQELEIAILKSNKNLNGSNEDRLDTLEGKVQECSEGIIGLHRMMGELMKELKNK